MKNKIVFWGALTVSLALAVWCGCVFCTQIEIEGAGLESLVPAYIIAVFLGVVFADFVHEGGHLLVGLCCLMGMKLPKFRLFSSSSVEVNPKGAKAIKARMLLTTSAGLFFNLLSVIFGLISAAVPAVPAMFCVVLPYSFYMLVINGVPSETKNGKTDGQVIWEILSKQPTAEVMLGILKVQGLVNSGTPLKDIDEALLLDLPQLPEDDINFIILTQLRYEYYLANDNDSLAYKYFMRYKDLIKYLPEGYKN